MMYNIFITRKELYPMDYTKIANLIYTDSRPHFCHFDIYVPQSNPTGTLIIYLMGGGLRSANKDSQHIAAALARRGFAVAVPEYRLMPEAQYPDFILDAAEAVSSILKQAPKYCGKTEKVFICGYSAGSYLAMMLAFNEDYLAAHGLTPNFATGYIFISGQPTKHFAVLRSDGQDESAIVVDHTAPLYHLPKRERHMPPMLAVSSDRDMPVRLEQNLLLVAALRARGHRASLHNLGDVAHGDMAKCTPTTDPAVLPCIERFILTGYAEQ